MNSSNSRSPPTFHATCRASGHSRRSPSMATGGLQRVVPLKCEYFQHPNGTRRCRTTDDGEHDQRCEFNDKTSRCNVAKPRAKARPSVAPIWTTSPTPIRSETKSPTRCVKQTSAKYTSPRRTSPPYPANQCRGQAMMGNDGNMYLSTPNVRDVYTWKKIANRPL